MLSIPERGLFLHARAGDDRAFADLVEPYRAPIFTTVLRLTADNATLAERVHQRTFGRVLLDLQRIDDEARTTPVVFQAFLATLVAERVRPVLRAPAPGRQTLREAVAAMPHDLSVPLLLSAVVGLRADQIAAIYGIDLEAARTKLFLAREQAIGRVGFGDVLGAASTFTFRS